MGWRYFTAPATDVNRLQNPLYQVQKRYPLRRVSCLDLSILYYQRRRGAFLPRDKPVGVPAPIIMKTLGQLFTSGLWLVKSGKEADFIRAWEAFAQWTGEHQSGAGDAHLLQDLEHPNRFLSFGPWESTERIQEWRGKPEFTAFLTKARELCEEIQPRTLKLVAYLPSRVSH